MAQIAEEARVKLPAHPKLHRRGEGPEQPGIPEPAGCPPEELEHAAEKHGDRECGADESPEAQAANFRRSRRLVDTRRRRLLGHVVTHPGHGSPDGRETWRIRANPDGRPLR